jgi:hypothetical protein
MAANAATHKTPTGRRRDREILLRFFMAILNGAFRP